MDIFGVAIIVHGVVMSVAAFDDPSIVDTFDYSQGFGPDAYGVRVPEGVIVSPGYLYEDGEFKEPPPPEVDHAELVAAANWEKSQRIMNANTVFLEWQIRLLLDIATDEQKAAVTSWVNYVDALRTVDTQQAPNIQWPEEPDVPEVES